MKIIRAYHSTVYEICRLYVIYAISFVFARALLNTNTQCPVNYKHIQETSEPNKSTFLAFYYIFLSSVAYGFLFIRVIYLGKMRLDWQPVSI